MVERKVFFNKINEKEKGYLIGLFYGDGYSYYDKKQRHYVIEYYLHSKNDFEIQKFLCDLLLRIGVHYSIRKDKRFECNRIRVKSKQLFGKMNFGIKKYDFNDDFSIGFISGLIDSDGYVNLKKSTIQIINTNIEIIKKSNKILNNFGINSKIRRKFKSKKDKLDSYILHIPIVFKSTDNISLKIAGWSKVEETL